MSQAYSRKLSTGKALRINAKRQQKLKNPISNHTLIAVTSFLSKRYGLLPCFCVHNPIGMMKHHQASLLSKSSNAFWYRNNKSKARSTMKNQHRNNSTSRQSQQTNSSHPNHFQIFRKSIIQRFKQNNKRKMPTITARSVTHKRTKTNVIKRRNSTNHVSVDSSNTMQANKNLSSLDGYDSQHSSYDFDRLTSQDNSYVNNEEDENDTLQPTISSFKIEQQNINATNHISQTTQETSQNIINGLTSLGKTKQTTATSKKKIHSKGIRKTSNGLSSNSSKRKKANKQRRVSKRKTLSKTSLSNRKIVSTIKRKKSTASLSVTRSKTNVNKMTYGRSPFPNPNIFHSIPQMQNSDEITKDNVHKNHLCCKPITSVKGLSTSDQKKLIENDYLTLISLLPIYLGSQGNFQHKIREKTNISFDGALELDRLMNEWSSAQLFIGPNSHYKTLTQTI